MRLCFVATAGSIHSYRWVKYFAGRGYPVDWISFSPLTFEPLPHVRFHDLTLGDVAGGDATRVFRGLVAARRLVREIAPDVLHAHYVGLNGVVAALTRFHPLVLTAWGSDVLATGRQPVRGLAVRWALRRAERVTCDARHMEQVMAGMGVRRNRISVIYFGTDTKRFCAGPRDAALAQRLGLGAGPVVISVRSLHPVYDIATLLRCVPAVLREEPGVVFLVVGAGPEEPALRRLAESLGITGSVRFLGAVPNEDLPMYFGLADVYVSTSLSDAGLAASTAEAMACRLPVVVTDSGENRLWVRDGENGFVVPCGDAKLLGEKIVWLLRNGEARRAYGTTNRQVIVDRNDFETEMAKVERLYAEISGAAGSSR